jgi:GT2 family glycosyltransferase
MNNTPPVVSVVICTFSPEHADEIAAAVRALAEEYDGSFEVVVVVDENPGLCDHIRGIFETVPSIPHTVLCNPVDRGISYARNLGIDHAAGEIIACIDDDAVPGKGWIGEIRRLFSDPAAGAATGPVLPLWENPSMAWFPEELYWVISCTPGTTPRQETDAYVGFGVNMAFRRRIAGTELRFNEVLGPRPGEWIGGEDTELFLQVHERGKKVRFSPGAVVYHKIPPKRIRFRNVLRRGYDVGYSIAGLSRIIPYRVGESVIRNHVLALLFRFYPDRICHLSPTSVRQMAWMSYTMVWRFAGYCAGLLFFRPKKE